LAASLARDGALPGAGLALIGTSHPKAPAGDLAGSGRQVTVIYATDDGLASPPEVLAAAAYLPPDTRWVRIEGGNHSQFGWYGFQLGDHRASISREQQQAQLVDALTAALGADGRR
ncbi:MAG TPA: alpha/beta hydrolase, partial [Herpetosiphonaceae bacterium]